MKVLVTGCAGFIGWRVCEKLLDRGHEVIGVDTLNDYYDPRVKRWRLERLEGRPGFVFHGVDIEDRESLRSLFEEYEIEAVINEAARAGVRYSLENPWVYLRTNAEGTLNLLELMREFRVRKMVLASTSSLYAGQKMPFSEDLPVNQPLSPYAASKKAAEVLAYTYHYLYGIDVTVVRYFTVYGPAGRPDMSIFRFIWWALKGEEAEVFGDGSQSRDFTYIDDIAEGTIRALRPMGYEIVNLGNSRPHSLREVISLVEKYTGRRLRIRHREFHRADMKATWADIDKAKRLLDWRPETDLVEGIRKTVDWFMANWDWLREVRIP